MRTSMQENFRRLAKGIFVAAGFLPIIGLVACGGPTDPEPAKPTPAVSPAPVMLEGAKLVKELCTVCHDSTRIDEAAHDRAGWEKTVDTMIEKISQLEDIEMKTSATVSAADRETIITYLASRPAPK